MGYNDMYQYVNIFSGKSRLQSIIQSMILFYGAVVGEGCIIFFAYSILSV